LYWEFIHAALSHLGLQTNLSVFFKPD
jgi:hypothetical protein